MQTRSIISKQSNRPEAGFRTFSLSKELERGIEAAGFKTPRPIQAKSIPAILEGRDLLGLAPTGTGKTGAFVLPILARLMQGRRCGPRALIIAPTRELAIQIHAEFDQLGKFTPFRAVTLFGGVGAGPQIRTLRSKPDVIIACPGRLLDLWQQREVHFENIEMLVLDEADHMFDMGFLPPIRKILGALPKRRQNLFFSATMPKEIRILTDKILNNPHVVDINHSAPANTIEHALYPVAEKRKFDLLNSFFEHKDFRTAIVFLRTKFRAKRLAEKLCRLGHNAIALQGNMSQPQRDRAMQGFRKGEYDVLVATDIASRGIDVAGVSHVINFDLPNTPDAYTHRIGRTGRAEATGKAFTFVTSADHAAVRAIERKLGEPIRRVEVSGFQNDNSEDWDAKRERPKRSAAASGIRGRRSASARKEKEIEAAMLRPPVGGRPRGGKKRAAGANGAKQGGRGQRGQAAAGAKAQGRRASKFNSERSESLREFGDQVPARTTREGSKQSNSTQKSGFRFKGKGPSSQQKERNAARSFGSGVSDTRPSEGGGSGNWSSRRSSSNSSQGGRPGGKKPNSGQGGRRSFGSKGPSQGNRSRRSSASNSGR